MTVQEVLENTEAIRKRMERGDLAGAVVLQHDLRDAVLRAIVGGRGDAVALATAALNGFVVPDATVSMVARR